MMKYLLATACGLMMSSAAFAQEYGALIGVHQTTADADVTGYSVSVDGKMGFKAGLAVWFELMEGQAFRTGFLYNQRHFEMSMSGVQGTWEFNYDYFDIPALFQYQFSEMIGGFGGLIVGVNINDDVTVPTGQTFSSDVEKMLPLLSLGINLKFEDQIGFDFYYERGIGKIADNSTGFEAADFATFGANFVYWF